MGMLWILKLFCGLVIEYCWFVSGPMLLMSGKVDVKRLTLIVHMLLRFGSTFVPGFVN